MKIAGILLLTVVPMVVIAWVFLRGARKPGSERVGHQAAFFYGGGTASGGSGGGGGDGGGAC